MKKRCPKCDETKPASGFYRKSTGALQAYCIPCTNQKSAEHYKRNKDSYLERNKRRRATSVQMVRDLKRTTPCSDCGVKYPYYVMDFDHRPGADKRWLIARIHKFLPSLKALRSEISKCDIVCANCHRERTHSRRKRP